MSNETKVPEDDESKIRVLTLIDTLKTFLIAELKSVIYDHKGSVYTKFLNVAIGIEYLGACRDHHPFEKEMESETRFNDALKNLFDKKYERYAKKRIRCLPL